jgi:hypothetical protein
MHFYGWKAGLKTGMYYLRSRPKADAIQFTVDQLALAESRSSDAIKGGFEFPAGHEQHARPAGSTPVKAMMALSGPSSAFMPSASVDSSTPSSADSSLRASPVGDAAPAAAGSGVPGASPMGKPSSSSSAGKPEKEADQYAGMTPAERMRAIRANLDAYDAGAEVCINCGS